MSFEEKGFEFGEFFLNSDERVLTKDGIEIPLTPKAIELLLELLKHPGHIVSKDHLMDSVWAGSMVEQANLPFTMGLVRKALDDDAKHPRFIDTIPKRGYRFVASVKELNIAATETSDAAIAPLRFRTWPLLFGLAIVLIAAMGSWLLWPLPTLPVQPTEAKVMVAILPFQNLTGDASQDYFSDGLTEEMITRLGNLAPDHIGVIGRTSVMHYKNNPATVDQIGHELQVKYVLEGSVRRDSDRVRIAAQLIQTKDQTHVWAQEYDRELTNLFSLQDEIAQEVADKIRSTLGSNSPEPIQNYSPRNYEAYDLYLKGQYSFNKRGTESLRQAIEYFEQATNKDPGYARAYAGLADSYALISGYNIGPQTEFVAKARAAAHRALEIDPKLAEAHTALALIVQNHDWDWQTAENEFRRAIELNPNYATAHHWYAEHLALLGRFDEALHESELARQLDPLSLIIAADNGEILYLSRQYDGSIQKLREVREMEPGFSRGHIVIHPYVEKRMFKEALADVDEWSKTVSGPWIWAELTYIYSRAGQQALAQHALQKLLELNRRQQIDAAPIIWAYTAMGNRDQAFLWIEKAYSQHSNNLTRIKVDPAFDSLRTDPRFQDLLRRVGLA